MRPHQRHDQIHPHQLLLLRSQQHIGLQLVCDPLCELFPIQVTDQVLKLSLVHVVLAAQGVHVQFDQVDMCQRFANVNLGSRLVLHPRETIKQRKERIQLLGCEPVLFRFVFCVIFALGFG